MSSVVCIYLDRPSKQVSVVRKASGERRTIVESKFWFAFRKFQAGLKRVNLFPKCENFRLFL